jgi:hypothetical protein
MPMRLEQLAAKQRVKGRGLNGKGVSGILSSQIVATAA